MLNFNMIGPLISFWQSKQLPIDVAIIPYPQVVHNRNPVTSDRVPNFSLIGHLISSWQSKQLLVGVATTKPHPIPHPYLVNNAQLVMEKPHAKFQPDWSSE